MAGCSGPAIRRDISTQIPAGNPPSGRFLIPLPGARIISGFGWRGREFHPGLDLKNNARGGDPVYASRAGLVASALATGGGYGRMILLKHDDGYYTRYAHLRRIKVRKGQRVAALQPIGSVGKSGRATTPHLHFEILAPTKRALDPSPLLFPK
jgi:murein DD-endopeptidase MepM/ murein hydrolase activator NlpD